MAEEKKTAAAELMEASTITEAITLVKLAGSGAMIEGFTIPEGYPYRVVIAVGKPGNERAIELAEEFGRKLSEASAWTEKAKR